MRKIRSRGSAGALLAVLAATLLLPLAALARVRAEGRAARLPLPREDGLLRGRPLPRRHGRHPVVRAVLVGLPRRGASPVRGSRSVVRVRPALLSSSVSRATESPSAFSFVVPAGVSAPGPAPAIPPPRTSIAPC